MPVPNPEQTASLASWFYFTFLDPTIWLAYRVPHLRHDQLPPLSDYDYIKNLIKRSYPVRVVYHSSSDSCVYASCVLSDSFSRTVPRSLRRREEARLVVGAHDRLQAVAGPSGSHSRLPGTSPQVIYPATIS